MIIKFTKTCNVTKSGRSPTKLEMHDNNLFIFFLYGHHGELSTGNHHQIEQIFKVFCRKLSHKQQHFLENLHAISYKASKININIVKALHAKHFGFLF